MKKKIVFFLVFISLFFSFVSVSFAKEKEVNLKFFFSTHCKYCMDVKEVFLPKVISKYKDSININVEYFNISEKDNFQLLLSVEKKFDARVVTPALLIGDRLLLGSKAIYAELENLIKEYLVRPPDVIEDIDTVSLIQKFRSFSPFAIIAAGLIDGINPCAFTVIIFFISFLTLMGYRRSDVVLIGVAFIFAVFVTYLLIGFGLFRGLYELKNFYTFLKITYYTIAGFCFILAYFNLRDFIIYRKTKSSEGLKVKLPKPIRVRINAIISKFYRKDKKDTPQSRITLLVSTIIVGFLVSLLEAVCTGQVYLPTIVFILKEQSLRMKAIFYLLLYNFMFVVPLILILSITVVSTNSKKIETFFRNKVALIKLIMFMLFLGLGIFLLLGV